MDKLFNEGDRDGVFWYDDEAPITFVYNRAMAIRAVRNDPLAYVVQFKRWVELGCDPPIVVFSKEVFIYSPGPA